MSFHFGRFTRNIHRWAALLTALPMLLVILSGLLLQVKKQSEWVQPATRKGSRPGAVPEIDWQGILAAAQDEKYAEAGIRDWDDIDRLDVRPDKGIVKIRGNSRWELQVDLADGKVLHAAYRRSDLIESLHDGSFFGDFSKLVVFLGNGSALLLLWCTGAYLWYLPVAARARKRKKKGLPNADGLGM